MNPTEQDRIARAKWEGEMERALQDTDREIAKLAMSLGDFELKHDKAVERIEERLGKMENKLTELQTKVLIYGAAVGGVGTLIMLLVLAFATKVIG